jgi:2-dehydro-3-deoxygalactonokinase
VIGVEWGHSTFRAWRFGADGSVRDRRASQRGLLAVPDFRFSDALREELGRWIAGGEDCVLICGPAGGTQGWRTARPAPCALPCGARDLARVLADVPFDWAKVKLVPGVRAGDDAAAFAETQNGEETCLLGAAAAMGGTGTLCLPGQVSCWAQLDDERIISLATYLTGETFAALRTTMPGRSPREVPIDPSWFDLGVASSGRPGGLLRHLAELRVDAAGPGVDPALIVARLSGLLIGSEVRAALVRHAEVHLVGIAEQTGLHARAITAGGGTPLPPLTDAVVAGLAAIGSLAAW